MSARDPRQAYLNRRRPNHRTPMWVAATGFALVIGALAVMARTTPPRPVNTPTAAVVQVQPVATPAPSTVDTAATPRQASLDNSNPAHARPQQTIAGGNQADFEGLTELIQSETSGPWEDVDGSGGTISNTDQMAGIHVDPNGLLTRIAVADTSGRLQELNQIVAAGNDNADITRRSRLRLVSLARLEQEVSRRLDAGDL